MTVLHLLGTGAVRTDPHRTTTMLALESEREVLLIDCGGDALQRALAAGIAPEKLTGGATSLVVTHEHADHVGGFPLLLERLWLLGLRTPLPVYGIAPALEQARRIHDAFDTRSWPDYPGASYHEIPHAPNATVLESRDFSVRASPGRHTVPTVALRIETCGGGSVTYSGDTRYHSDLGAFARGSSLLVHEATGDSAGHATALDAARIAAAAAVERAVLVHLPVAEAIDPQLPAARAVFAPLDKGEELGRYALGVVERS